MKYIAKKTDTDWEITQLKEMPTINGEMVEVIIGTNKIKKEVLKATIKRYEEETEEFKTRLTDENIQKLVETFKEETIGMIEQHEDETKDLKEILEAIERA